MNEEELKELKQIYDSLEDYDIESKVVKIFDEGKQLAIRIPKFMKEEINITTKDKFKFIIILPKDRKRKKPKLKGILI